MLLKHGVGGGAAGREKSASCSNWVRLPSPVQLALRETPRGGLLNIDGGKEEMDFKISASEGVAWMIRAPPSSSPQQDS